MKTHPLTESLLGMFLEWNEDRDSLQYTLAIEHVFPKTIDADRLAKAVEDTISANDTFSIRFVETDDGVHWMYDEAMRFSVERLTMSDAEVDSFRKTFARPFDVFTGPLVRCRLVETPSSVRLFFEVFHGISDGTSFCILFKEIGARYDGRPVTRPSLSFADYAEREKASFASAEYAEAKEYACKRFEGRSMTVPECSERVDADSPCLRESLTMPRGAVDAFCASLGVAPNIFFMGVFARTLSLFANEKDVLFCTVNHGRGRGPDFRAVHGFFVKTLPVLGEAKADESLSDYFGGFRIHKAGVYPFTHCCRDLGLKPGWTFIYQEGTVALGLTLGGVSDQGRMSMTDGAGELPGLQVFGDAGHYIFEITCIPKRYGRDFLTRFLERFAVIAGNFAAASPGARLDEIPTLTPDEFKAQREFCCGEVLQYDASKTFVDLFRARAAENPDAIAVIDCETSLTYAQLDAQSDALAASLVSKGVSSGGFVAVKLQRRASFLVAVLGIQKCGCGYVPLDPEYPQDRLDYMISDSGANVVVDEKYLSSLPSTSNIKRQTSNNVDPDSPAYMIYTSGSTGRPKGVVVSHRALTNLVAWTIRDFNLAPGKKNVHVASFSFDASVLDIFGPLAAGCEVHILDEFQRRDIAAIGEYLCKNKITGMVAPTQMGLALLNTFPDLSLEYIMLGGEKLTQFAKNNVRVFNGYGPTEFCVTSSYHVVDQSRAYDIPIGRAVPNTATLVVDKLGQPVPRGMTGELALAGVQLSDGYWNQPEKTDSVFVRMPFDSSILTSSFLPFPSKMYRTGDLGRYNDDGELDFLGRIDFQVKLRGFRIEIGEIEHSASTFPGVTGVIALVRKLSGADHLVLYYTSDAQVDPAALKAHMAKTLTPYMVPDYFVELDAMPLTPGGKIDRKALPAPQTEDIPVIAPATDAERAIFRCVAETLHREDFGVTHDFNNLGLTSLGAMELIVKLGRSVGARVTMRQLSDHPTVRELASLVEAAAPRAARRPASSRHRPRRAAYPMTENQRGIYSDWLLHPETTQYNVPAAIRFPKQDPAALAAAVEKVIAAHAAFSVRFAEKDGEIIQKPSAGKISVGVETLDAEPDSKFIVSRMRPFAAKDEALVRATVFSVPGAAILFLDAHHTVFDGFSLGIFLRDLTTVLNGGEPVAESYTALDASLEERDYLESELAGEDDEWFGRYLDGAESTSLETSPSADGHPGELGRRTVRIADSGIAARCRDLGVTPSDYFLTSFTELLRRVGRSDDILIQFVSAGRTDPDLSDTIGMFVKTLPLRGIKDAAAFPDAVRAMHARVADILDRERASYVRLSEKFGLRPEIMFAFEGGIFTLPNGASLIPVSNDTAKTPLAALVTPGENDFELALEYDRSLYSDVDMERLLAMFATLSRNLVTAEALRDVPLVSDKEAERILAMSYGGDLPYDASTTFLDLFRANVEARPDATAVVDCETSLTYAELDARSDALASLLLEKGVTPGGFAGVMLPRRVSFIVSALAVQKCGAGYIPIDPEYPRDRVEYILENSGAKILIDEAFYGSGFETSNIKRQTSNIKLATPDSPAYMIYTSGSTGRPKGVVVPHRALRNLVAWMPRDLKIGPESRVATHPSFSFDASVIDIFPALAAGAELHIFAEPIRKDLSGMHDYIVGRGITATSMSTQIGMALMNTYPDLTLHSIQMGGEKMMPVANTNVRIINGYGPTEFTVTSSYESVDQSKDEDIPIGRAVPNTYSIIVDRYGQLLPEGAAGELALVGPQLSNGYWKLPEKTAAVFTDIPPSVSSFLASSPSPSKMYRTGDLARYREDGKIQYLGRLDFQVKLRGFRIEIGEVESIAKAFPGVGAVAAEVRDVGGAKHLVLYYEGHVDEEALRAAMASRLTSYMVPDYFVGLDTLPVTPNGKINRRALPAPSAVAKPREYVEPTTDAERKIAAAFAEVLKADRIGATDDFFEVGGTSIVAIMAIIAVQKAGFDIQYGDLFKYKTPRALAAFATGESAPEAKAADTATGFDFGAHDYTPINDLLAKTRSDFSENFEVHSLGNVLLAGASGYLGMHVLRYLLEKTDSTVYALVRSKRGVGAERRIDAQWVYYFGERIPEKFNSRLLYAEGDICDAGLASSRVVSGGTLGDAEINTVINCAALVKHYVADDLMDRINVGGVENLIRFCEARGAALVQTSTYSIGGTVLADSNVTLCERNLYVGQTSDNDYIRTKFAAERLVLDAAAAGRIRGKIMRLGNLMGRESDGEFQMNFGSNAFVNSLKTYKSLGAYPLEELVRPIEMSPIDRVAEAVCLLSATPDDLCVFHPFNCYRLDMGAVISAMNARGFDVDLVGRKDFSAHVDALRNDPSRAMELQGILHYAGHLLENRKMTPVDNALTTTVLYKLGFRWKPADDGYLDNFFRMLEGMGVFE